MKKLLSTCLAVCMLSAGMTFPVSVQAEEFSVRAEKTSYSHVSMGTEIKLVFSDTITSTNSEIRSGITLKNQADKSANIGLSMNAEKTEIVVDLSNCFLESNKEYTLVVSGIKSGNATCETLEIPVTTGLMPIEITADKSDSKTTGTNEVRSTTSQYYALDWIYGGAGALTNRSSRIAVKKSSDGSSVRTFFRGEKSSDDAAVTKTIFDYYDENSGYDTLVVQTTDIAGSPTKGASAGYEEDASLNKYYHLNFGNTGNNVPKLDTATGVIMLAGKWKAVKLTDKTNGVSNATLYAENALVAESTFKVPAASVPVYTYNGTSATTKYNFSALGGIRGGGQNAYSLLNDATYSKNGQMYYRIYGTNIDNEATAAAAVEIPFSADEWHTMKQIMMPNTYGSDNKPNIKVYFDGAYIGTYKAITALDSNFTGLYWSVAPKAQSTNDYNTALNVYMDNSRAYWANSDLSIGEAEVINKMGTVEIPYSSQVDTLAPLSVKANGRDVEYTISTKDNGYTAVIAISGLSGGTEYDVEISGFTDAYGNRSNETKTVVFTTGEILKVAASKSAITDFISGSNESVVVVANAEIDSAKMVAYVETEAGTKVGDADVTASADKKSVSVSMSNVNVVYGTKYNLKITEITSVDGQVAADIIIPVTVKDTSVSYVMNENFEDETLDCSVVKTGYHNGGAQSGNSPSFDDGCQRSNCSLSATPILTDHVAEVAADPKDANNKVFKYSAGTVGADGTHGYVVSLMNLKDDKSGANWKRTADPTKNLVTSARVYIDKSVISAAENNNKLSCLPGLSDHNNHQQYNDNANSTPILRAKLESSGGKLYLNVRGTKLEVPTDTWLTVKTVFELTGDKDNSGAIDGDEKDTAIFKIYVNDTLVYTSAEYTFWSGNSYKYQYYGISMAVYPKAGTTENATMYVDDVKIYQPEHAAVDSAVCSKGVLDAKFATQTASNMADKVAIADENGNIIENAIVSATIDSGYLFNAQLNTEVIKESKTYQLVFLDGFADVNGQTPETYSFKVEAAKTVYTKSITFDGQSATFDVANDDSVSKPVCLIVAAYGEKNKLVGVKTSSFMIDAFDNRQETVTIDDDCSAALTYKAFVWNSIYDLDAYQDVAVR